MRKQALQVVLVLVGLLFVAGLYPLVTFLTSEPALAMMLSLYVTLGIFLLLAVRDPAAHRSLIYFAVWSSFAHATVMAVQTYKVAEGRRHLLVGTALFGVIGLILLVLMPAKPSSAASAAGA